MRREIKRRDGPRREARREPEALKPERWERLKKEEVFNSVTVLRSREEGGLR